MPHKNLRTVPVYEKALELCQMSRELASYFSFNKDLLKLYQSQSLRDIIVDAILTDSILIQQQIAQAEFSNSLRVRKESASFINISIRNINSYCTCLEKDGVKEKEYISLLRQEISSFRNSFKNWRSSLLGE